MQQTRVTVEDAAAGATVVRITGDLDKLATDAVRARVEGLADGRRLVLDLGSVTFLDSAGLHALFGLESLVRSRGGALALAVADGCHVARIVQLAHLEGAMPVRPSVAEAAFAIRRVS
jgi:anti-anti-sigma factor